MIRRLLSVILRGWPKPLSHYTDEELQREVTRREELDRLRKAHREYLEHHAIDERQGKLW